MNRQYIDQAVRRQLARLEAVLRDVQRSGGKDTWSHLFSHGHAYPTVRSAIKQNYLTEPHAYHYELTPSGRQHLDALDHARVVGRGE